MKRPILLILVSVLTAVLFSSCQKKVTNEKLVGTWNYVKVEGIRNPEESLTQREVAEEAPSITFSKGGELTIIWGNKVLSKGKFTVEGDIIRYTETLPDGITRPIPFLVKQLNETTLVFETMEEQGTRIEAQRRNKHH